MQYTYTYLIIRNHIYHILCVCFLTRENSQENSDIPIIYILRNTHIYYTMWVICNLHYICMYVCFLTR